MTPLQQEHEWDYSNEDLKAYAQKLLGFVERGLDVYVFFLNDAEACAPKNAKSFISFVSELLHRAPFEPPRKAPKGVAAFFAKKAVESPPLASSEASPMKEGGSRGSVGRDSSGVQGNEAASSPAKRTLESFFGAGAKRGKS